MDEQERISKLHDKKPILKILAETIPWDAFIPLLDQAYQLDRKKHSWKKAY